MRTTTAGGLGFAIAMALMTVGGHARADDAGALLVEQSRSLMRMASLLGGWRYPYPQRQAPGPSARIGRLVDDAARRHRIRKPVILAVIACESGFRTRAVSRKGALGLMQVMPATAWGEFGVESGRLFVPEVNVAVGTAYLRRLADRFDGDFERTIAAYNAGPGRVGSGRALPAETRRYLACVRRQVDRFERAGRSGQ